MKAKIGMSLLAGMVFTLLFAASTLAAGANFPVAKFVEAYKSAVKKAWGQAPANVELVGYRQNSPTEVMCYVDTGDKYFKVTEKQVVLLTKPDGTEQWFIYIPIYSPRNKEEKISEGYYPIE